MIRKPEDFDLSLPTRVAPDPFVYKCCASVLRTTPMNAFDPGAKLFDQFAFICHNSGLPDPVIGSTFLRGEMFNRKSTKIQPPISEPSPPLTVT